MINSCSEALKVPYLHQVALLRESFDEQPVQGGGETGTRQVGLALQLPRLCSPLDVQAPGGHRSGGPGPESQLSPGAARGEAEGSHGDCQNVSFGCRATLLSASPPAGGVEKLQLGLFTSHKMNPETR